ncbi:hypothetical protein ACLB1R_03465 [Escherichia coli]
MLAVYVRLARQATAFHGISAVDLGKMVVGELLARSEIPAEVIERPGFWSGRTNA